MSSKRCPNCSKVATTFSAFLTSYKAIQCQHCDTKLRFGMGIAYLFLAMVIIGLAVPTFLLGINDIGFDYFPQLWMTIGVIAGYLAIWWMVTSVLVWQVVEFEVPKKG